MTTTKMTCSGTTSNMAEFGDGPLTAPPPIALNGLSFTTQPRDLDFSDAFEQVKHFQKQVFGSRWPHDAEEMTEEYVKLIMVELVECLQETNFKPHKRRIPLDAEAEANIRKEIVDCLIYLIALAAVWFPDANAWLQAVFSKIGVNNDRLDNEFGG